MASPASVTEDIHAFGRALVPEAVPLAVALGAWVAALGFFLWPTNPAWGVAPIVVLLAWGLGWVRPYGVGRAVAAGLMAFAVVWQMAAWQVARHEAEAFPWARMANSTHWVQGQVANLRAQPDNPQRVTLTLQQLHWYGLPAAVQRPAQVNVGVWASQTRELSVGTWVAAPIRVLAPEEPKLPGMRDSRLWQWRSPERATGYTVGSLEPLAVPRAKSLENANKYSKILSHVESWRQAILIHTATRGQGVQTALLIGEQRGISAALRQAYSATGLSHLIAISGMQMTLVGLGIFWLLRRAGAAVPTLALRVHLKFWAACGALLGVAAYSLLVGAGPAIMRAAFMVGLVLLAVLLGRVRGLVRGWALACTLILLLQPHWALGAGLQLSASATLALALWARTTAMPHGPLEWLRASVLASVVAGAATAPLVAVHFGSVAPLGVLANLVAVPLMTAATYLGFAGLMLWPIGWQDVALFPQAWLIDLTNAWALNLAALQGGAVRVGGAGAVVLALGGVMTVALVMLRRWRALTAVVVGLGGGLWGWQNLVPQPERLLVAEGGTAAWRITAQGSRLLWAEEPSAAARWARLAQLPPAVPNAQPPTCCADASILPVASQDYAYAQYSSQWPQGWSVTPLRCARPWQRIAERCHAVFAANPPPTDEETR